MKKILAVFIVAVFLTSLAGSIGVDMPAPGIQQTSHASSEMATRSATFTSPEVAMSEGYAVVTVPGCAMTTSESKPMLPVWRTTFELPYGSRVTAVDMEHDWVRETRLHLPVRPARPASTPDMETEVGERTPDPSVYESSSLYPKSWYTYDVACGLHDGERKTMVTVSVYPVRYSPDGNLLRSCRQVDVSVSYQPPSEALVGQDEHDLLVVCPRAWEASLERLAEHKESHGVATQVVCMECIKAGEYFPAEGRDDAETLKYFIKNAVGEWGVTYVLLVGGRIPGIQERWHLPVRYVHVYWADETRYASDLYYADLYNGSGMFSTWDTDGNDVFYEWGQYGSLKDRADLLPDVHLGRWACRTKAEVDIMVDKTIAYENSQGSRRISLIGGDNFPQGDEIEGEVVCDKSLSYLDGFEASRVYASETDVTAAAIRETLNTGAMFLHMHGHGSPMSWSTHKPGNFDEWEKGIDVLDLPLLFNDEYTIALIGGCHTAMFNVSMTVHPWTGGVPSPEGTSWWLARKVGGGGIASLGYTAFPVATPGEEGDLDGDGVNEPDCVESGYGYMQLQVFDGYGQHDLEHLGACWSHAVTSYATHFKEPAQPYHLHTIQSFVLLGDPSLKIGGY